VTIYCGRANCLQPQRIQNEKIDPGNASDIPAPAGWRCCIYPQEPVLRYNDHPPATRREQGAPPDIANLTAEDQIGYAKVIDQNSISGKLLTTILFVETDRSDKLKHILEKKYTIEGDIVHFDALIVKFSDKLVGSGAEKSLYLWHRVYGEKMAPAEGFSVERPGAEPRRYKELTQKLSPGDRKTFWGGIWALANDPEALKDAGVTAVYGNAIYSRLQKGYIYVFKITATGQLYPEVVPDI